MSEKNPESPLGEPDGPLWQNTVLRRLGGLATYLGTTLYLEGITIRPAGITNHLANTELLDLSVLARPEEADIPAFQKSHDLVRKQSHDFWQPYN